MSKRTDRLVGRRARRRARTRSVSLRRQAEHARKHEPGRTGCPCEASPLLFAHPHGHTRHDCRRRVHGQPRLSRGMCRWSHRRFIYFARRLAREHAAAIANFVLHPEDDLAMWIPGRRPGDHG